VEEDALVTTRGELLTVVEVEEEDEKDEEEEEEKAVREEGEGFGAWSLGGG